MNWIPVSDRLPSPEDYEPSGAVIVYGETGYSLLYPGMDWAWETKDENRPTHWARILPPGAEEKA